MLGICRLHGDTRVVTESDPSRVCIQRFRLRRRLHYPELDVCSRQIYCYEVRIRAVCLPFVRVESIGIRITLQVTECCCANSAIEGDNESRFVLLTLWDDELISGRIYAGVIRALTDPRRGCNIYWHDAYCLPYSKTFMRRQFPLLVGIDLKTYPTPDRASASMIALANDVACAQTKALSLVIISTEILPVASPVQSQKW